MAQQNIFFILCSILLVGVAVYHYTRKECYYFFSPLVFHAAVLIYYCVIGPLFTMKEGTFFLRGVDHFDYSWVSWLGCIVALGWLIAGFSLPQRVCQRHILPQMSYDRSMNKVSMRIYMIGLAAYASLFGTGAIGQLNFLSPTGGSIYTNEGAFAAYFSNAINMLMVPICLHFASVLNKKEKKITFLIMLLMAIALYLTGGFRYRLVILGCGLLGTYHLIKKIKVNLFLLTGILVLFIAWMGVIELTRSYGGGLKLDRLTEREEKADYLETGLNETAVFFASGYLMDYVQRYDHYTGFDFLTNALCMPIPRKLWPGKPDGSYILGINELLYDEQGQGQAYLYYAEHFLSFGWLGVIFFSFVLGLFYKKIWVLFTANKDNPLAIVALSVFNGFIYVIVSRGYFSQTVTSFFFTVYPIFFIIRMLRKKRLRQATSANGEG